jgi:hypothetical protein
VGNSKYGVLADGSKQARKDLFCIANLVLCTCGCVFTKLVNIVDLQHDGSAHAMARALACTVVVRCELDINNMIYFCIDNTNSMSGYAGGCVALLSHGLDISHDWCTAIPRAPCVLHVWHPRMESTVTQSKHFILSLLSLLPTDRESPHKTSRTQNKTGAWYLFDGIAMT